VAAQYLGKGGHQNRPKYTTYFSGSAKVLKRLEEIRGTYKYLAACEDVLVSMLASVYAVRLSA
jgi:hypothetical protein